jgi:hypothetical protein
MRQGSSWIYECIPDLPQHVSASGCYVQAVVGPLEATQAVSVLWAYMDYDPSSVASCCGTYRRVYSGFSSCGDCQFFYTLPHSSVISTVL